MASFQDQRGRTVQLHQHLGAENVGIGHWGWMDVVFGWYSLAQFLVNAELTWRQTELAMMMVSFAWGCLISFFLHSSFKGPR